jgi:hypothetical protein
MRRQGVEHAPPGCRETRPQGRPRPGERCPPLARDVLKLDGEGVNELREDDVAHLVPG